MTTQSLERRKGHYLGTEIDEKWWKRYKKDKFFARGNGEYWYDDAAFHFHRYLTKEPIQIPFAQITEINIGKSHAGRWLLGHRVMKLIWEKDGLRLSSGFLVSSSPEQAEEVAAELRLRIF
jgi:hypothetical protein